jgi:hypothetical protein
MKSYDPSHMKAIFTHPRAALLLLVFSSQTARAAPDLQDIQNRIRECAAKIEKSLPENKAEPIKGLVERVDRMLKAAGKTEPRDPRQKLANEMQLTTVNFSVGFAFGEGGFRPHGVPAKVLRFRKLIDQPAEGIAEVNRCLELGDLAESLEWSNAETHWEARGVETARAALNAQTESADAMSMLAWAIWWKDGHNAESIRLLRRAREIDPAHITAKRLLLEVRFDKAMESAALRREVSLEEKKHEDILRELYEKPLSEDELDLLGKKFSELEKERLQLTEAAAKHGRIDDFFALLVDRLRYTQIAMPRLVLELKADHSLEEVRARSDQVGMNESFNLLESPATAQQALTLARDKADVLCKVWALMKMHQFQAEDELEEDALNVLKKVEKHMNELVKSPEEETAAAAEEELLAFRMLECRMNGVPPPLSDILDLVKRRPLRQRGVGMLLTACGEMGESSRGLVSALMDMHYALVPCLTTRTLAAAAASRNGLHDRALDLLDLCDAEKRNDLALLSQRISTMILQDSSPEGVAGAMRLYDGINTQNILERSEDMDEGDRENFIQNHALVLALADQIDVADQLISSAQDAGAIEEETLDSIRKSLKSYRKAMMKSSPSKDK